MRCVLLWVSINDWECWLLGVVGMYCTLGTGVIESLLPWFDLEGQFLGWVF